MALRGLISGTNSSQGGKSWRSPGLTHSGARVPFGWTLRALCGPPDSLLNSATWLHRAKECTKQELKEEVYKYFTGEDYEPYEMVYFKLFESQLPVVERALYVAARLVGSERSRGYCLELICADFLAGRTEESTPEEMLLVIHRLVHLLPPDYQARLANHSEEAASEAARKC